MGRQGFLVALLGAEGYPGFCTLPAPYPPLVPGAGHAPPWVHMKAGTKTPGTKIPEAVGLEREGAGRTRGQFFHSWR